jgi:tetratricopeptide (TPR) repeat protein
MKKMKCAICLKVKGRRLCKIKEKSLICSRCCVETRSSKGCSSCSHYAQTEQYSIDKMKKSNFKEFTAKIDPEVDEAVDNALLFVEKGKIAKGEELLTGLIEKYPDFHIVQYGMGTVLAIKGNYSNSIVHFDKCLEIFPYFVEAWFNKGTSFKNLLDVGNAIKSFQKVIEFGDREDHYVNTAHEFIRDMEANIYRDTGLSLDLYIHSMEEFDEAFSKMHNQEYEQAIVGFQKVLSLNKNHAQSFGNLALCFSFLGEKQKAIHAFDKALKIDPKYEPAIRNKAFLLSLKDGEKMPSNQIETIEYYKEVVEANSSK